MGEHDDMGRLIRDLIHGRIPFSRKDDEHFLAAYINTIFYKQRDMIDRLPDEKQQEVLDRLLAPHREKWYFTWRVFVMAPLIFSALWGYQYLADGPLAGEELVLMMFIWVAWSLAITFIVFYTYKHVDLWRIAKSDLAKELLLK